MTHEELVQALARGMRPEAFGWDGTRELEHEAYGLADDTIEDVSEAIESKAYDEVQKEFSDQLLEPITDLQLLIKDLEDNVIEGDTETLENVVRMLERIGGRY